MYRRIYKGSQGWGLSFDKVPILLASISIFEQYFFKKTVKKRIT